MSLRNRKRTAARNPATKAPRKRLLIVCEGECTEPLYIRGFARWVKNPVVEVTICKERGDPKKVVDLATSQRDHALASAQSEHDAYLAFDEVWCVFDRDDHEHFRDAINTAQGRGFKLAVSNPCVELWLLLHFRENPGARHRDDLRAMLRKTYLPGYDKKLDFGKVQNGFEAASKRALRLSEDAAKLGDDEYKNPTTGFFRLTDAIRQRDDA